MNDSLNGEDFELIVESLRYTKMAFEKYEGYPDNEFKRERLKLVDSVTKKVKALRDEMQKGS
jgi:hypothetical protein